MSDFNDRPQFQPPSFQPPAQPAPPAYGAGLPPSGPPTSAMFASPSPESQPKRKRSKGVIIGAAVAVVAIIGAGAFAITKVLGNDDTKGGAASGTEAGESLVTALNDEDILGAVDLLLPGERETFRQPMIDLVDNLKRLDVLGSDADPNKVSGLDINLTGVKVAADKPVADDIQTIHITAKDESTVDGKALPLGDIIVNDALGGDEPASTTDPSGAPVNLTITTVQKDGRWYLSLFYTIAEDARQNQAQDQPVPSAGIALAGADQPEDAVDQLIKAATKQDLPTIIGGLNPNEAEALQRYAPLFLDEADKQAKDADVAIKYSDASYTVTGSGDHRHVTIPKFELTVDSGGETVSIAVADGCATVTPANGDPVNSCDATKDLDKTLEDAGLGDEDKSQVKDLITTIQKSFDDFKGSGIAVDEVGGKWYVSPITTGFDSINAVLGALDKSELQDLIDAFKKLDGAGISLPGIGRTGSTTDFPDDTTVDTVFVPTPTLDTDVPDTFPFPTDETVVDTVPDSGTTPTADEFRSDTEDFITGSPQVVAAVGETFVRAECETPASTDIGTKYTCQAFTDEGEQYVMDVEITSTSGFTIQDFQRA